MPQQFFVDLSELKKVFRQFQRQYHPDRYARSTPQEQRLAVQFSAHLNTAHSVLGNPVLRAMHLLMLLGIDVDHQNSTIKDTVFLVEQMELREDFAEAKERLDRVGLQRLLDRGTKLFVACQEQFEKSVSIYLLPESTSNGFVEGGAPALMDEPEADQLILLAGKMQFYEKLISELSATVRRMGD